MKVVELRALDIAGLTEELNKLLRESVKMRIKKANEDFAAKHLIRKVRRDIARIRTLISEKEVKS